MSPANNPQETILFRISAVEKDVDELRTQLNGYVLARENDLRIQSILDTLARISNDVTKLSEQQNKYQEGQSRLITGVLWGALSLVGFVLTSVLIAYITHFFH